jgi:5'(3')-deoxyribonucleotidase
MKPKIWLDCDGVLCDFVSGYLDLLNVEISQKGGGTGLIRENVKVWDLGVLSTPEHTLAVWNMINTYYAWVERLKEEPGSSVALQYLRSQWSVGCLTSPTFSGSWMHQRARWLMARGFDSSDIIFAQDKSLVRGSVLVDDKPESCEAWQKQNPHGLAILFDQPWNQGEYESVRCVGWVQTVDTIKRWLSSPFFTGIIT